MDSLVRVFLEETREQLALIDRDAQALARGDADACARARRLLHTLKGSAGFLGLAQLEALAHAAEDLIGCDLAAADAAALRALFRRLARDVAALEAATPAPPPTIAIADDMSASDVSIALPAVLAAVGPVLGKEFNMVVDDGGVRVDRRLGRSLRTILLHLVRNAADHGISAHPAHGRRQSRGGHHCGRVPA
jgi:chemotaxis protein histidine kinase CheA